MIVGQSGKLIRNRNIPVAVLWPPPESLQLDNMYCREKISSVVVGKTEALVSLPSLPISFLCRFRTKVCIVEDSAPYLWTLILFRLPVILMKYTDGYQGGREGGAFRTIRGGIAIQGRLAEVMLDVR